MAPHEQRVVDEKAELDGKISKLKAFCYHPGSPIFKALPPLDRTLLTEQYAAMEHYSNILGRRIERFHKDEAVQRMAAEESGPTPGPGADTGQ